MAPWLDQRRGYAKQIVDFHRRIFKPPRMGDSSRRLEHKPEVKRHLLCPRPKNSFRGEPVKTIVDLDRRES